MATVGVKGLMSYEENDSKTHCRGGHGFASQHQKHRQGTVSSVGSRSTFYTPEEPRKIDCTTPHSESVSPATPSNQNLYILHKPDSHLADGFKTRKCS